MSEQIKLYKNYYDFLLLIYNLNYVMLISLK